MLADMRTVSHCNWHMWRVRRLSIPGIVRWSTLSVDRMFCLCIHTVHVARVAACCCCCTKLKSHNLQIMRVRIGQFSLSLSYAEQSLFCPISVFHRHYCRDWLHQFTQHSRLSICVVCCCYICVCHNLIICMAAAQCGAALYKQKKNDDDNDDIDLFICCCCCCWWCCCKNGIRSNAD